MKKITVVEIVFSVFFLLISLALSNGQLEKCNLIVFVSENDLYQHHFFETDTNPIVFLK